LRKQSGAIIIRSYIKTQSNCTCPQLILELFKLIIVIFEKGIQENFSLLKELEKLKSTWKSEVSSAVTKHVDPIASRWTKIKMAFAIKEAALQKKLDDEKVID
jgi:hypothetical protein